MNKKQKKSVDEPLPKISIFDKSMQNRFNQKNNFKKPQMSQGTNKPQFRISQHKGG